MSQWRSRSFWASAMIGWLAAEIVLALGICVFGPEDMTAARGIVVNVLHQLLSLGVGYACGLRQWKLRKPERAGFPVITKDDGDSPAG